MIRVAQEDLQDQEAGKVLGQNREVTSLGQGLCRGPLGLGWVGREQA